MQLGNRLANACCTHDTFGGVYSLNYCVGFGDETLLAVPNNALETEELYRGGCNGVCLTYSAWGDNLCYEITVGCHATVGYAVRHALVCDIYLLVLGDILKYRCAFCIAVLDDFIVCNSWSCGCYCAALGY